MKLMPSSTTRRSVAMAWSRLGGSPQIPGPVIRMAPNPSRLTVRSPPTSMVPAAPAVGCAFTRYLLVLGASFSRPLLPRGRGGRNGRSPRDAREDAREDLQAAAGKACRRNSGVDQRPRLRQFYRFFQRLNVISAVVPLAVDEERRCPGHAG